MTKAIDAASSVSIWGREDQNDSIQKGNMAGNPEKHETNQKSNPRTAQTP